MRQRGPGPAPAPAPADPVRAASVRGIAEQLSTLRGPLLPILHEVVATHGYVTDDDVMVVAEVLNLSRADVHGVVTFYHDLRRTPPAAHRVALCRGEACQSRGAEGLFAAAADRWGGLARGRGGRGLLPGPVRGRPVGHRRRHAARRALARTARRAHRQVGPMTTVWVPCDAAAVALGADAVADAIAAAGITVRRNGSRGMLWLEPLVEVETERGRVGYANLTEAEVGPLLDGALDDTDRCIGVVDEHEWLARQHRVSFARVGVIEPTDLAAYREHGGLAGLQRALSLPPEDVVAEVTASGLRGRGGAGFPAGIKWETVRTATADVKFVCCNADEGDSGTFADRMLIEGDPFTLIEGMTIAALAVGATEGYVYLRSEYPHAVRTLRRAIDIAYAHGVLGESVLGSGRRFDLDVRVGAGAYICGEETSMLESLEGKRGEVRAKPPIPALEGLFGRPTVVNNVLTLGAVPMVLADGGEAYAALGTGRSRGTQVFQLAGNVARGGIVEADFGVSLGELVEGFGGGTASGRPVKAVQVGGPLGAYLPASRFDLPMDYEAFADAGAMVGHGGVVVWDDTMDAAVMARFAMEFCAKESCGKCTPCRIGSTRGVEVIDRIRAASDDGVRRTQLVLLEDLCTTMTKGSLCAMGGLTPMPVRSALEHFPEDFGVARGDGREAAHGIPESATVTTEGARP